MRRIKKILITASLMLIGLAASAQILLPDGLSADELKLLEVLGFKDKPYTDAQFDFSGFTRAKENLRRTGLLSRCAALVVAPDVYDFDVSLREAIKRIVRKQDDGWEMIGNIAMRMKLPTPNRLAIFKFRNQTSLWALMTISATERNRLFENLQTTDGRQVLQHFYAVNLLQAYSDLVEDPNAGTKRAASPIILKTYFAQSKQLPNLRSAIATVLPELIADFDRIQSIDKHTTDDAMWLIKLSNALAEKNDDLKSAFLNNLSVTERSALKVFMQNTFFVRQQEAQQSQFYSSMNAMSAGAIIQGRTLSDEPFKSMKVGDRAHPDYFEFIQKLIAKDFYPVPELHEIAMRAGPKDWIDNEHLKFCPEGVKP